FFMGLMETARNRTPKKSLHRGRSTGQACREGFQIWQGGGGGAVFKHLDLYGLEYLLEHIHFDEDITVWLHRTPLSPHSKHLSISLFSFSCSNFLFLAMHAIFEFFTLRNG
ncbi:hypothetical protein ACJX0J_010635, partial [Zea mays]